MLLFYVDESGSTHLESPGRSEVAPYFSLAAVGIQDSARSSVAGDFQEIKRRHFGEAVAASAPWGDTEIKGRHLWLLAEAVEGRLHGELPAPYRALVEAPKSRRKQGMNALLYDVERLFTKFRPTVFTAVVDKREHGADTAPLEVLGAAYAALYQSVALTMEHVHGGASAAFVADQQGEHERFFETGAMRDVRDRLASKGVYRPDFNLLLDKPLWIDSALSTWDREIIQLADLVAFAVRAWVARGSAPRERHYLWRSIAPTLAFDWRRGTGVRGAGLTLIPDSAAFPQG